MNEHLQTAAFWRRRGFVSQSTAMSLIGRKTGGSAHEFLRGRGVAFKLTREGKHVYYRKHVRQIPKPGAWRGHDELLTVLEQEWKQQKEGGMA